MEKQLMWGNSTSSMQTEGAFDLDGKGKSVYDIREASENQSDWKVAIDEYHRYEEDIRLMKEMGSIHTGSRSPGQEFCQRVMEKLTKKD